MEQKYTSFRAIPQFTHPGNYAVDYPLDSLCRWVQDEIDEMGLQLNPDFQRGHVWTEEQQRNYIEFLLRGGTSGRDLYFNYPSWNYHVADGAYNDYVCVDGLQRITAIQRFIGNKLKVFGSFYKEFTDSLRLSSDVMRVHVNDLQTKQAVLTWYIEMNNGGTPHSKEEIARVQSMLDGLNN